MSYTTLNIENDDAPQNILAVKVFEDRQENI